MAYIALAPYAIARIAPWPGYDLLHGYAALRRASHDARGPDRKETVRPQQTRAVTWLTVE